jgi:predicted metal-dependent HD superfamily phosphohydrolase
MQPLIDHWRTCFGLIRLRVPADEEFDRLIGRYSEPHRAYHTIQHIEECFREFEAVRGSANSPSAVGLALFFHDAIYDTHAHDNDNEEKSAGLARQVLAAVGAEEPLQSDVRDLILATRHAAMPETNDQKVLVDIDLSILGADSERFRRIRAASPPRIFLGGRDALSSGARQYPARVSGASRDLQHSAFQGSTRRSARENLKRSIAALAA